MKRALRRFFEAGAAVDGDGLYERHPSALRGSSLRTSAVLVTALLTSALLATGCAQGEDTAGETGLGVMRLALGAAIPGATHMRVDVYHGPLVNAAATPKYALACGPYLDSGGAPLNPFTLDKLPARKDYAVTVRLFSDAACTTEVLIAYRAEIAVQADAGDAANNPYYLQPAMLGAFAGMAVASDSVRAEVAKRSCTSDAECTTAHPAAVCAGNKCALESLFPLNGGARRGLPAVVGLADGRVAIHGGASVQGDGNLWAATSQRVEIFDPKLGRFEQPAATIGGFEDAARVALATASSTEAAAFLVGGGSARIVLGREGAKLRTGLDDATCGAASDCPMSANVYRVDVQGRQATSAALPAPRALPIVAQVVTAQGPRLLVAGGATVPLPKSGDPRTGDSQLCALDGKVATCTASKALMQAGRAGAATLCLDVAELSPHGCKRLLVLGGRASKSAQLAEIYHAGNDAFEPVAIGPGINPEQLHGGSLVRLDDKLALLIGATSTPLFLDPSASTAPGTLAPLLITIDESTSPLRLTLAEAPLGSFGGSDGGKRALPAVLALPARTGAATEILVAGGIDAAGKILADALVFDASGTAVARVPLEAARYGARLAAIGGSSPFGGCAMLVGGFGAGSGAASKDEALAHIEIYCRKPLKP